MITWILAHKIKIVIILFIIWTIIENIKNIRLVPPNKESLSYSEIVKLPFKQIKQIYSLNPERLKYEKVLIKKDDWKTTERPYLLLNYSSTPSWNIDSSYYGLGSCSSKSYRFRKTIVAVEFSLIDTILFNFARKHHPNRVSTETAIIEAMQADIDKLRELSQRQIEEARKITEQVKQRTKKDR